MVVVISAIAVTGLRSSVFANKVATGLQADTLIFEGAESALNSTYTALASSANTSVLFQAGVSGIEACITETGWDIAACADDDRLDSKGLIQSRSLTFYDGFQSIDGTQISVSGTEGLIVVDHRINIMGTGSMPSFDIESDHVQETLKRGIKAN